MAAILKNHYITMSR